MNFKRKMIPIKSYKIHIKNNLLYFQNKQPIKKRSNTSFPIKTWLFKIVNLNLIKRLKANLKLTSINSIEITLKNKFIHLTINNWIKHTIQI